MADMWHALEMRLVQLREQWGIPINAMDLEKIPEGLKPVVKYAELLGIGDDGYRDEMVSELPLEYGAEVVARVEAKLPEVLELLRRLEGVPEGIHSSEYVGFACLVEAFDLLTLRLDSLAGTSE